MFYPSDALSPTHSTTTPTVVASDDGDEGGADHFEFSYQGTASSTLQPTSPTHSSSSLSPPSPGAAGGNAGSWVTAGEAGTTTSVTASTKHSLLRMAAAAFPWNAEFSSAEEVKAPEVPNDRRSNRECQVPARLKIAGHCRHSCGDSRRPATEVIHRGCRLEAPRGRRP